MSKENKEFDVFNPFDKSSKLNVTEEQYTVLSETPSCTITPTATPPNEKRQNNNTVTNVNVNDAHVYAPSISDNIDRITTTSITTIARPKPRKPDCDRFPIFSLNSFKSKESEGESGEKEIRESIEQEKSEDIKSARSCPKSMLDFNEDEDKHFFDKTVCEEKIASDSFKTSFVESVDDDDGIFTGVDPQNHQQSLPTDMDGNHPNRFHGTIESEIRENVEEFGEVYDDSSFPSKTKIDDDMTPSNTLEKLNEINECSKLNDKEIEEIDQEIEESHETLFGEILKNEIIEEEIEEERKEEEIEEEKKEEEEEKSLSEIKETKKSKKKNVLMFAPTIEISEPTNAKDESNIVPDNFFNLKHERVDYMQDPNDPFATIPITYPSETVINTIDTISHNLDNDSMEFVSTITPSPTYMLHENQPQVIKPESSTDWSVYFEDNTRNDGIEPSSKDNGINEESTELIEEIPLNQIGIETSSVKPKNLPPVLPPKPKPPVPQPPVPPPPPAIKPKENFIHQSSDQPPISQQNETSSYLNNLNKNIINPPPKPARPESPGVPPIISSNPFSEVRDVTNFFHTDGANFEDEEEKEIDDEIYREQIENRMKMIQPPPPAVETSISPRIRPKFDKSNLKRTHQKMINDLIEVTSIEKKKDFDELKKTTNLDELALYHFPEAPTDDDVKKEEEKLTRKLETMLEREERERIEDEKMREEEERSIDEKIEEPKLEIYDPLTAILPAFYSGRLPVAVTTKREHEADVPITLEDADGGGSKVQERNFNDDGTKILAWSMYLRVPLLSPPSDVGLVASTNVDFSNHKHDNMPTSAVGNSSNSFTSKLASIRGAGTLVKLADQRDWAQVYIELHIPSKDFTHSLRTKVDEMSADELKRILNEQPPAKLLFFHPHELDTRVPFYELPLINGIQIGKIQLQRFDTYTKIHTFKLIIPGYKEVLQLKADKILQLPERLMKRFSKPRKDNVGILIDHASVIKHELSKIASFDYEALQSMVSCIEDVLFTHAVPNRSKVQNYKAQEINCEMRDEFRGRILYFNSKRNPKTIDDMQTVPDEIELDEIAENHQFIGQRLLNSRVRTRIFMKAFLKGVSPVVDIGINDIDRQGHEIVGRYDIIPLKTEEWIKPRDWLLSKCADLTEFKKSRALHLIPPDACRVEIARFRSSIPPNYEMPLLVKLTMNIWKKHIKLEVEVTVADYAVTAKAACKDVCIRIPWPDDWVYHFRVEKHNRYGAIHSTKKKTGKIRGFDRILALGKNENSSYLMETSTGQAKYEQAFKSLVWRIDQIPSAAVLLGKKNAAYKTHVFNCDLELLDFDKEPEKYLRFASIEYSLPACVASKAQIRSIAVTPEPSIPPEKWARTKANFQYDVEIQFSSKEPKSTSLLTNYSENFQAIDTSINDDNNEEEQTKFTSPHIPKINYETSGSSACSSGVEDSVNESSWSEDDDEDGDPNDEGNKKHFGFRKKKSKLRKKKREELDAEMSQLFSSALADMNTSFLKDIQNNENNYSNNNNNKNDGDDVDLLLDIDEPKDKLHNVPVFLSPTSMTEDDTVSRKTTLSGVVDDYEIDEENIGKEMDERFTSLDTKLLQKGVHGIVRSITPLSITGLGDDD
ncbi:hypothetical protein SNEBB_007613 [Seison nebaliae]|nr:hypothetical protein SNEBB_007613 [Seison nebaliae]